MRRLLPLVLCLIACSAMIAYSEQAYKKFVAPEDQGVSFDIPADAVLSGQSLPLSFKLKDASVHAMLQVIPGFFSSFYYMLMQDMKADGWAEAGLSIEKSADCEFFKYTFSKEGKTKVYLLYPSAQGDHRYFCFRIEGDGASKVASDYQESIFLTVKITDVFKDKKERYVVKKDEEWGITIVVPWYWEMAKTDGRYRFKVHYVQGYCNNCTIERIPDFVGDLNDSQQFVLDKISNSKNFAMVDCNVKASKPLLSKFIEYTYTSEDGRPMRELVALILREPNLFIVRFTSLSRYFESGRDDFLSFEKANDFTDNLLNPNDITTKYSVFKNRPFSGKMNQEAYAYGATDESEAAVQKGLEWLAQIQDKEGYWDALKFDGNKDYNVGITGLALLAFAGAGNTEKRGIYSENVRRAVAWLTSVQAQNGNLAQKTTMYSHAIATIALCELAAIENVPHTVNIALAAANYIVNNQNYYKAWRYWPKDGDNDTSVTSWCIDALSVSKYIGADIPAISFTGVKNFLDEVLSPTTGEYGYTARPTQGAGREMPYQRISMTACGLFCRLKLGSSLKDKTSQLSLGILTDNLPDWKQPGIAGGTQFFYYWYFGTQVLFQVGGDSWTKWNSKVRDMLVQHQNLTPGELLGSWDPSQATHYCQMGGRVYSTTMAILTLETYYRYAVHGN